MYVPPFQLLILDISDMYLLGYAGVESVYEWKGEVSNIFHPIKSSTS